MEICEVCGKSFKDKSGLAGHMRFSHPTAGIVAGRSLEQLSKEVGELRQVVSEALGRSTPSDYDKYCAGCHKRDLELLEEKHKLEKAQDTIATYQDTVKALENKPEEKPVVEYPSWSDFLEHSSNCAEHKQQYYEAQKRILEGLPDEMFDEEAQRRDYRKVEVITVKAHE